MARNSRSGTAQKMSRKMNSSSPNKSKDLYYAPFSSKSGAQDPKSQALQEEEMQSLFEMDDKALPINKIDELVLTNLKTQKIEPAKRCSDTLFLRRVYLDLVGRIPTVTEVKDYLADQSPKKRMELVDKLFKTEDYYLYQTMCWGDFLCVKSEFPINLWPKGTAVFTNWIYEAVRNNTSYDRFARELLTSSGSNFREPPVNFWRAVSAKDNATLTANVCRVFMARRFENLKPEEKIVLQAFFSRVAFKKTAEWKEEVVYWNRDPLEYKTLQMIDGSLIQIPPDRDPRKIFADWLIRPDNPIFNRAIVNLVWARLFGYGIVQEPDDFRPDNPPAVPGLLDHLSQFLAESNYDLQKLYRYIISSRTYQQSPIPRGPMDTAEKYFAVYPSRRIGAEVIQDIFMQIFQYRNNYISIAPEPYSRIPNRVRTVEIYDSGITNAFLEKFNRVTRDTGGSSDRGNNYNRNHGLFLINSTEIHDWTRKMAGQVGTVKNEQGKTEANLDFLWMSFLSRPVGKMERKKIEETAGFGRDALEDITWMLVNSKEFLTRH